MNNPPEIHYRFCPICSRGLDRRSKSLYVCGGCSYHFYQNSKPSAGALILSGAKEKEILLVKRGVEPFKGYWDIPGGFIENGEEPVKALQRELMEELGAAVAVESLFAAEADTYPCFGVPSEASNTLCLYYKCSFIEEDPALTPKDDIIDCRWFSLLKLPENIAFEANRRAISRLSGA